MKHVPAAETISESLCIYCRKNPAVARRWRHTTICAECLKLDTYKGIKHAPDYFTKEPGARYQYKNRP